MSSFNRKIVNKNWLVLLPMALILSLFLTTIYIYISYKDHQMSLLEKNYQEAIKTNTVSWKEDLLAKINDSKFTTNPKLTQAWKQSYDVWTSDLYNTIDNVSNSSIDDWWTSIDATQMIDKIITNRTTSITRLWESEPNKKNNVFEIDLVNFLKNDWSAANSLVWAWILSDLKLEWGTTPSNLTDTYLVMTRVKKNSSIVLDNTFEEALSKKQFWVVWQYTTEDTAINNLSVDYKKLKWSSCVWITDPDVPVSTFWWCQKADLYDILSNTNFDLQHYLYKVFIVFWQTDAWNNWSDSETPFKIYSDINWTFWVGNFAQADVTLLTGENVKKRVFIKTSTKNSVLPYLIYSLWVKWKIIMENSGS